MGLNREALRTTAAGAVPAALLAVSALGAAPAAQAAPGGIHETHPDWRPVSADRGKSAPTDPVTIRAETDSGANGGTAFLSGLLDQTARIPLDGVPPAAPPALGRGAAVGHLDHSQQVRGTATLHTTLTPIARSGTFVARLYDVGPPGIGKPITRAPYTWHGRTPGVPFTVDLPLYTTAHGLPAGHRLALVVETVDPLCLEHNPPGAQLTFSSPANDPSHVSVPLREQ